MESKKRRKEGDPDAKVTVARTPAELQRMRLDKLMKNPTKPVFLPEKSKDARMKEPPEFIRNVWGSSAGAGSGDFHVYRGVRRREYARQKFNDQMSKLTGAEQEYHKKVHENQKSAEERTAKKRAKRQKKKQKMKNKKMKKDVESSSSEDEDEDEKTPRSAADGKETTRKAADERETTGSAADRGESSDESGGKQTGGDTIKQES